MIHFEVTCNRVRLFCLEIHFTINVKGMRMSEMQQMMVNRRFDGTLQHGLFGTPDSIWKNLELRTWLFGINDFKSSEKADFSIDSINLMVS